MNAKSYILLRFGDKGTLGPVKVFEFDTLDEAAMAAYIKGNGAIVYRVESGELIPEYGHHEKRKWLAR